MRRTILEEGSVMLKHKRTSDNNKTQQCLSTRGFSEPSEGEGGEKTIESFHVYENH